MSTTGQDVFVLVPAPALGPASWSPVAGALAATGHLAVVPSLAGFADAEHSDSGPPYAPRLVRLVREQVPAVAGRALLVVHSGAGVLAPFLADAIDAGRVDVLFADAALPPRSGPGAVVDGAFLPFIRDLAREGVVPPWPRWWPQETMAELVPDEEERRIVLDEACPLPLAFYEEALPPDPASWPSRRCGYLRFSEGYADLAAEAAARGWPTSELPGEHLHMVVRPADVAAAIAGLASEL